MHVAGSKAARVRLLGSGARKKLWSARWGIEHNMLLRAKLGLSWTPVNARGSNTFKRNLPLPVTTIARKQHIEKPGLK